MHKVKIENGELKYRTLTITGTGGSPIYDPAGNRLVAIHWRGAIPHDPFRAGTRITQSRIRIIQSWIDSDRGPLARNSVAHVTCSDPTTGRLTEGTGVIVSAEGHLVTAGSVASGAVSCTAAIGDSLAPREPLEMVGPLANGRLMVLRLSSPEGAQPVALPKESIPSLNESAQIAAFLPGEFGSYSRRTGKILETRDAYFELDNADGGVLAGGAVVDAEERLLGFIFGIRRKEDGTVSTLVANVSAIAGDLEALTSSEP